MLYEYSNNELSREQIDDMLKKSKALKRNIKNIAYFFTTIALGIFLLIAFIATNFKWDNRNFILIGAYVIGVVMVLFKKEVNIDNFADSENKGKSIKQGIEFKDNTYRYRNGKLNLLLNQHTIREIITSKEYTLIGIVPIRFKLFTTITVFIPNKLFGSEEKYNEFMNIIRK